LKGCVDDLSRTNGVVLARSMIISGSAKVVVAATGKGTAIVQSEKHGHVHRLDWKIPYEDLNVDAKKKQDARKFVGVDSATRGALTKSAVKRKQNFAYTGHVGCMQL
jgi:hypothetical protein